LSDTTTAASAGAAISLNVAGNLSLQTPNIQNVSFYSFTAAFTLGDVPSYAQFTSLYERYRLEAVEIILTPFYTVAASPQLAGNGGLSGMLHTIVDYNDYGALAASGSALTSMRGRASYRTLNITSTHPYRWVVKPRIAVAAYSGVGFSDYANMAPQWTDTVSTDLQHYGIKWLFEVANTSAVLQYANFKLEFMYSFSFKDVKA
jgi:hypothetical protein